MLQARIVEPQIVRIENNPVPAPGPEEVLIQVHYCGICGSDVHAFHGQHPFVPLPVIPGHEFSGVVAALGEGVSDIRPGQRVTVEPSVVCGRCYNCRTGRYNICDSLRVLGCGPLNGGMAEFVIAPAHKVIPLPDEMTLLHGAMIEPVAVGVRTVKRAGIGGGERVLVIGAGTIGMMAAQAAKAEGAAETLVVDFISSRLEIARGLGVDHVADLSHQTLSAAVEDVYGPDRADVILECVGVESSILSAIQAARKGTRIVVAGVHNGTAAVPMGLVQDRELELVGTLMYVRSDFMGAVQLMLTGEIQVDPLITNIMPLQDVADAFALIDRARETTIKVLLKAVMD